MLSINDILIRATKKRNKLSYKCLYAGKVQLELLIWQRFGEKGARGRHHNL